ncbi:hypothetical protein [Streptomyces liangshanensis]|uniref:Uncharacterized protein n=1 Tax=Streptomyces liangshanensis TaxID=2717324 RepID=A0A6G9H3V6_9ACTN|nr:hypothetical protein [Streptomyces liangshanensis]QIQ05195.1 hypothetical protein HA039_25555 [Streptomyces liangshanensis]
MGWTVLYIAFGIVALWLLGEVLLQYKARLRWRLLAFTGFMGVVLGVLMPSVFVIALGAIAFAVGQAYVTLSFRRGFSTGWALGGSPGASRRRKAVGAVEQEPTLEVSDLEYEPAMAGPAADVPMDAAMTATMGAVYEPQPLPDDTGQYGVYKDDQAQDNPYGEAFDAFAGYGQAAAGQPYAAQDPYADQQTAYQTGQGVYAAQDTGQGAGQDAYAQYGYGADQSYAAYADPYTGAGDGGQQAGAYDSYGGQQQYADPYAAQQYSVDTPPGGVWVPQQRENDQQVPPMPQDQPHEYGYDPGYNNEQQYRY